MTDYEDLQKRCQRGATNLNDASNLLAECYGVLGKLEAENEALRKAAGQVLLWIEAKHRPPVADQLETGRMALVRLHALACLDAAMSKEG